jgi:hypothetical protein
MFGTAAIRVLTFPWLWRPEKVEHDVARLVQVEASNHQAAARAKRSPRDAPWLAPEWWESHHYERR